MNDRNDRFKPRNYFGTRAAGLLVYCFVTKRFLLLKRSGIVNEPTTYGIISGKIEDGEDPLEGLKREIAEETNRVEEIVIYPEPFYIFTDKDFKFYNYFGITNQEFTPKLDMENSGYQWLPIQDFGSVNLHFGVASILQNFSKLIAIIQKYTY